MIKTPVMVNQESLVSCINGNAPSDIVTTALTGRQASCVVISAGNITSPGLYTAGKFHKTLVPAVFFFYPGPYIFKKLLPQQYEMQKFLLLEKNVASTN
jgi:hypothetical protein